MLNSLPLCDDKLVFHFFICCNVAGDVLGLILMMFGVDWDFHEDEAGFEFDW